MIAVVMMVSRLRVMWRRDRPSQDGGVAEEVRGHRCSLLVRAVAAVVPASPCLAVVADDGEEDVLEGRLLLDVLDLGGREQLLELGEGAVRR